MTIVHAVILGIVEGITEFLPISSTGHLILAGKILKLAESDFLKTFDISIQLGAILAVVFLYRDTFFKNREVLKKVFVAFIPTGVIGLALYKLIKTMLLGNTGVVLWSLGLGGVALIVFELLHRENPTAEKNINAITYGQALGIGSVQALSVIPGVSRAAATIVGGLALGVERKTIVEFSFLLALPTMLAATGLDLVKNASHFSSDQLGVLATGALVSFAVAIFSIRFLMSFISRHSFIPFGIYRIALALFFCFAVK